MKKTTYKEAGVDIAAADRFLDLIKPMVKTTARPGTIGTIGGFSGFFKPSLKGMKRPVLVASTDGVGTKLLVAELAGKFDTVGIDLVAMSVDDVIVVGAEPLLFLDYMAVGKLEPEVMAEVMKGIVKGCRTAHCALLGGETAELPGLYAKGKWDLAGFCVGLVDEPRIIDGRRCRPGDAVIGLASSGLHSNGYSLVRSVFSEKEIKAGLWKDLLRPTRIYSSDILQVMKKVTIKAMAHITGGGFYDNIPRVVPEGLGVRIKGGSWPVPALFRKIQASGGLGDREMYKTLNMGIGMALVVARADVDRCLSSFAKLGCKAWEIGKIVKGEHEVEIV